MREKSTDFVATIYFIKLKITSRLLKFPFVDCYEAF